MMKRKEKIVLITLTSVFFIVVISYLTILTIYYHKYLYVTSFYYVLVFFGAFYVLGFLSIIFISFLLYNNKHKVIRVKKVMISFALSSVTILSSFGIARLVILRNYKQLYAFTIEKWQASAIDDRWHYIPSLEKLHKMPGKTALEVEYLLGEPDSTYTNNYVYYIGYGRGFFSIDQLNYTISFDEHSIVTKTTIYQT